MTGQATRDTPVGRRRAAWIGAGVAASSIAVAALVLSSGQAVTGATARVLGQKLVASSTGNNGCGNGGGGGSKSTCYDPKTFTLSGTVSGVLLPGTPRTLAVRVSNPNNQQMQVTQVSGVVGTPTGGPQTSTKPACSASWVTLTPYTYRNGDTKIIAPANGTVTVNLPLMLTNQPVNQDNCKGVAFAISLSGEGIQVQ